MNILFICSALHHSSFCWIYRVVHVLQSNLLQQRTSGYNQLVFQHLLQSSEKWRLFVLLEYGSFFPALRVFSAGKRPNRRQNNRWWKGFRIRQQLQSCHCTTYHKRFSQGKTGLHGRWRSNNDFWLLSVSVIIWIKSSYTEIHKRSLSDCLLLWRKTT